MNDACRLIVAFLALIASFGTHGAAQALAPVPEAAITLGSPLRVALDQRVTVKRVGQPVTGTLIEAVYAYDRLVFPAGVRVLGHVSALTTASKMTRARAWLGGSFVPLRQVTVSFDTVVLDDGQQIPIYSVITGTPSRVKRQVARGAKPDDEETTHGAVAKAKDEAQRARDELIQRKNDAIAAITAPDKMTRLKEMAIDRLPYHPQYLAKGIVYTAKLVSPVRVLATTPVAHAAGGRLPAPDSVLKVRLVTPLDSATTPRGTPIEGVVTEPVFTADHQLILAEGTTLRGEVTFTKPARRFRRNGQLRFLFESVQPSAQAPAEPLLASLYSVDTGADDRVAVDEEGGSSVSNSKTRFIAPLLALVMLRANAGHEQRRPDGDADDGQTIATGGVGSRGLGGFLGFGAIGAVVGQFSPPVAIVIGAVGVARTVYSNVLAKGREVSFPADTALQVRLAPGRAPSAP